MMALPCVIGHHRPSRPPLFPSPTTSNKNSDQAPRTPHGGLGIDTIGIDMWLLPWMTALALAGAGPPTAVDTAALVTEARRIQQADLAEWARLAFRRRVFRQRLDPNDGALETSLLDFWVTPRGGGRFDEALRQIDGRLPGQTETREHRRARRFEKRYRTAFMGDAGEYEQGDFSLTHFMTRPTYRYRGIEVVDGIRCHRLDFPAQPEAAARGVASRISASTEGTLWLETTGLHAIRAESRLVRPVSAMMGLIQIERVEITVTTLAFGRHRLPREFAGTTTSVLAGRTQRKRNRFLYSGHQEVLPSPDHTEDGGR